MGHIGTINCPNTNTYSLLETKRLIELGQNAPGKDAAEAQMILNHKAAIEYIVESVEADESETSAQMVCNIHALLSDNLLGDPGASGRLRNVAVGISGTVYQPLDNPHQLRDCFQLFIDKLNLIADPFEKSLFSLAHLSYLQAFEDVNKRTARLVANIPLIRENFRPLSFIDVSQEDYVKAMLGVYERTDVSLCRDLFVWAYKRSCQRYSAVQQSLGEANYLKLKHRDTIKNAVSYIVVGRIPADQVEDEISRQLEGLHLPAEQSKDLFQLIEEELVSLHEGNIARFRIRPSEFRAWKEGNQA